MARREIFSPVTLETPCVHRLACKIILMYNIQTKRTDTRHTIIYACSCYRVCVACVDVMCKSTAIIFIIIILQMYRHKILYMFNMYILYSYIRYMHIINYNIFLNYCTCRLDRTGSPSLYLCTMYIIIFMH